MPELHEGRARTGVVKIDTAATYSKPAGRRRPLCRHVSGLSSLTFTCALLAVLALLCLAGAWIPQAPETGDAELLKRFGTEGSKFLKLLGLSDVFRSPAFLIILLLLFANLVACTATRLLPRVRARLEYAEFLDQPAIEKLPLARTIVVGMAAADLKTRLAQGLAHRGYALRDLGDRLLFERGKTGALAGPFTHAGLVVLLIGACVTALTSYRGMLYLSPGESAPLAAAGGDVRPWLGATPRWNVTLESTRREVHPDGRPKQWYSTVSISDAAGRQLGNGTISVNSPLTVGGVDFYQSDWRLASVRLSLGGTPHDIPVQEIDGDYMSLIPLLPDLALIVAVREESAPLRLYVKHGDAAMPHLFGRLGKGQSLRMGHLILKYETAMVKTGLKYKHDPGLPITYAAFAFFMLGAIFVAVPYQRLWAKISALGPDRSQLSIGCRPSKLKGLAGRDLGYVETLLGDAHPCQVLVHER